MADKMKCVKCDKDIKPGEWECFSGEKHQVEKKEYFMKDAPQDPTAFSFKHARTMVHNVPPQRSEKGSDGVLQVIPGGHIEFIRGYFCTEDPEIQFWLDKRNLGVSKAEWEANYFTVAEKQERRNSELAKREAALAARENDLLNKVKQEKASGRASA